MKDSTDTPRSGGTQVPRGSRSRGPAGVLALCVALGLVFLGIGVATDRLELGVGGLAIMLGYALVLVLLRRRNEAASLLAGDIQDERQALVMQQASSFMGYVLLTVVLGGFLWTLATGSALQDVFSALAAVGGVSFMVGVAVASRRT